MRSVGLFDRTHGGGKHSQFHGGHYSGSQNFHHKGGHYKKSEDRRSLRNAQAVGVNRRETENEGAGT